MSESRKPVAGVQPSQFHPPHVGRRKSFEEIEAKAREVLRQRGFSAAQIEAELNRTKREPPED